jgi:hypothetical protein
MNEQPQSNNLQHDGQQEGGQPLYRADNATAPSSYNGYDLTRQPAPVAPELPMAEHPAAADADHVDLVWEASEYVHHVKSAAWYLGYAAIMAALLAVAYFLTQSWTFMVLVVVMAITVAVFASRPPRTLRYALSDVGIQIEDAVYYYSDFRAFGIIADGALFSVMLIPTKRFMPAVSMYFAQDDGEDIVDILSARLPMEDLHLDAVDHLIRRLRF